MPTCVTPSVLGMQTSYEFDANPSHAHAAKAATFRAMGLSTSRSQWMSEQLSRSKAALPFALDAHGRPRWATDTPNSRHGYRCPLCAEALRHVAGTAHQRAHWRHATTNTCDGARLRARAHRELSGLEHTAMALACQLNAWLLDRRSTCPIVLPCCRVRSCGRPLTPPPIGRGVRKVRCTMADSAAAIGLELLDHRDQTSTRLALDIGAHDLEHDRGGVVVRYETRTRTWRMSTRTGTPARVTCRRCRQKPAQLSAWWSEYAKQTQIAVA